MSTYFLNAFLFDIEVIQSRNHTLIPVDIASPFRLESLFDMPGRTRPIEKFAAAAAKCSAEVHLQHSSVDNI